MSQIQHRPLYVIATEIRADWSKQAKNGRVPQAADAYLRPMQTLSSITENYIHDSARSVVMYFLSNAGTWRGPVARRVKAELKALLADK
jgi:hypothetical protein